MTTEVQEYTREELVRLRAKNPELYRRWEWHRKREKARGSLWWFTKNVVNNPVLYEPLHRPVCNWLQEWGKTKKLLILPRGHVKSNICTVSYILWRIVNDPNIRVLIASHKNPDAEKFLGLVKSWILHPTFVALFPEIRPTKGESRYKCWRSNAILVDRAKMFVENTVECTSMTARVVGRHYELLVGDDLVTDENVATKDQLQATIDFHGYCQALLDPGAKELLLGTRYDFSDLYGTIIDTPEKSQDYEIMVRRAIEDGQPIYPTRFTMAEEDEEGVAGDPITAKKSLPKLRRTMGSWIYNSQMMSDPIDDSVAVFKKADVQAMEVDCLPPTKLNYFRVCDMSSDKQTKDSRTAIVTGGVDANADIYITDIWLGNYTPNEIIEELFRGQQVEMSRRPLLVGFEPAPYERLLKTFLNQRSRETGVFVPYKFLKAEQAERSKDERIMGIQPWIENHKIRVVKGCPHFDDLKDELLRFPRYRLKDIIDALAQIEHFMWPSGKPVEQFKARQPVSVTFDKQVQSMLRQLDCDTKTIGNNRVSRAVSIRMTA